MKRDLKKLEQEGIELQYKNGKAGLSIMEVQKIYGTFLDEIESKNAGIVDLIFKCFSLGVAAGSRIEKNNQRKQAKKNGLQASAAR